MMLAVAHEGTGPRYSTIEVDRETRLPAGSRVAGGDLEVVGELARGGMSIVYRALDHRDGGRGVALKIVTAEVEGSETAARFRNEARLGATLADHPHVVSSVRVGQLDGPTGFEGRMYLVSELVEGDSLDDVMGTHRVGLDWRRACTIARDVARALVDLHACGIVHRDIKPGNVLVTREEPEQAKLIDFGLAYATGDGWAQRSPDLTQEGHAPGTVLYMSPQQVAHERPAPSMDIYALGVMLYELFSGNPPYHRQGLAETLARKCDPERSPYPLATMCPELDGRLCSLVHRCLDFQPSARPDAVEVVRVLERVLDGSSTSRAAPVPATPRDRRWLAVPAAVVVLVLGGGAWRLSHGAANDPPPVTAIGASGQARAEDPATAAVAQLASPWSNVQKQGGDPEPPDTVTHDAPARTANARTDAHTIAPPSSLPDPVRSTPAHARPRRRVKTSTKRPADPQCPEGHRDKAKSHEQARRWSELLRSTDDPTCWHGAKGERVALQTRALFETKRYAECARIGKTSKVPKVIRWARICEAHTQEVGQ